MPFDIDQLGHIWIIAGIILAISEIFIPGFAVMCLAIGALATSVVAYLGFHWIIQVTVFCISTLLTVLFIRPVALKFLYSNDKGLATNVEALVGQTAVVIKEIPGSMEKGEVKVGGEGWNAISKIDLPIPKGEKVIVRQVDGNKLIVELEKSE